jgi:lipopolysaccharide biosynthesis protein
MCPSSCSHSHIDRTEQEADFWGISNNQHASPGYDHSATKGGKVVN